MNDFQIVGIMLIRNEDVFIERAIRNVLEFCDRIIITDHQSTDQTFDICQRLAVENPKVTLRRITTFSESSDAIAPYYGTNTWVFAVDGDEIYEPTGLKTMRNYVLEGMFSKDWCIFGNALNVTKLDMANMTAQGYLAPPSRSTTKLYNFSIIKDWPGSTGERLHGSEIVFKPGYHAGLRRYLHQELDWEHSYFRYLHTSFLPRSSADTFHLVGTRLNPDELTRIYEETNLVRKFIAVLKSRYFHFMRQDWKNRKYRRGPLVEKTISSFFA